MKIYECARGWTSGWLYTGKCMTSDKFEIWNRGWVGVSIPLDQDKKATGQVLCFGERNDFLQLFQVLLWYPGHLGMPVCQGWHHPKRITPLLSRAFLFQDCAIRPPKWC